VEIDSTMALLRILFALRDLEGYMTDTTSTVPAALAEIIEDFKLADDREKLDLLLEFSDGLPDLPADLEHLRDDMVPVEECQSPVFMHVEPMAENGNMRYHFVIPESAPTVRGFAGILVEGTAGATPEQVLQIPADFFIEMGLQKVLSPQRLNGIGAILMYMKRLTVKQMEARAG
jgi:cysteine desulfuration protein SufE